MNREDVIAKTNEALVEEFELDAGAMKPEALLYEDLGLDSLDAVDMVVLFEQRFGIKIGKDPAIVNIMTLGELHDYVVGKLEQKA
jgi:acyl carrier protein